MPVVRGLQWYLSFDCGTKALAWAVIGIASWAPDGAEARARARLAADVAKVQAAVARARASVDQAKAAAGAAGAGKGRPWTPKSLAALEARIDRLLVRAQAAAARGVRGCVLAGGGVVDLAPGREDADISTIERIRLVQAHLRGPVAADLAAARRLGCPPATSRRLRVAVEYQMTPGSGSQKVGVAIVAFYDRAFTFYVGPGLKNQLRLPARPDLDYPLYVQRYAKAYDANKAHATDVYFTAVAPAFAHRLPAIDRRVRKDFADAAMQVVGFHLFGVVEGAEKRF